MRRPVPHTVFLACVALYALVASCGLWVAHQTPWLGVSLYEDRSTRTLRIGSVDALGPAQGQGASGRQLLAISNGRDAALAVDVAVIERDPDHWRTWEEAAAAREALDAMHRLLRADAPVILYLDGGEQLAITPQLHTPVRAFSWTLWLALVVAAASFLCAAGVFAFRPEREANRYFALTGALVMIQAILAGALETSRLGMSGVLLDRLFSLIHLSEFALIASVAALSGCYPTRLTGWKNLRPLFFGLAVLAAWLDLLHLGEGPATVYRTALLLGLSAITALLIAQLRVRPQRGRGFVLALMALLALDVVLYLIPPLLPDVVWIGRGVGALGLNLGYILLGALIYRVGLLDVDRWMIGAWLTFTAGAVLLAIDALVVTALGHSEGWFVAALILCALAWVYFPLRQSAWLWLARRRPLRDLRDVSSLLFARLLATQAREDPGTAWRQLLTELFAPLHVATCEFAAPLPLLVRGGLELKLPGACGAPALVLSHADRGNRLFTGHDVRLVQQLAALADLIHDYRDALDSGAQAERQRIAQDLHDDVVPPLLSLIYRADSRELSADARLAMRELRGILGELDGRDAAARAARTRP